MDYDPICGPCEEGYNRYEGEVLYRLALQFARRDHGLVTERTNLVVPLAGKVPADLWDSLVSWACEPMLDDEPAASVTR